MLFKTATHLKQMGVESIVVSFQTIGTVGRQLVQAGIPVFSLGDRRTLPDPRTLWKLRLVLSREKPDLLQTHMYWANLYGLLAVGNLGIPIVWGLRCSNMDFHFYRFQSKMAFNLGAVLSRLPHRIVVNSKKGYEYHASKGYSSDRMTVVPNGFETDHFRPNPKSYLGLRQELGVPADAVLVGRIARYDPAKDYGTFLKAAGIVASLRQDVYFLAAGEGVCPENPLFRGAREGALRGRAFLLGRRDDIAYLTAGLDIAVSSSAFGEGFPNVVGEAMASEVPCVVTDVGDSAEIVGETGRVVSPGDYKGMATAVAELLSMGVNVRRRLGFLARRRVQENYGIDDVVKKLAGLYKEVIEARASSLCAG